MGTSNEIALLLLSRDRYTPAPVTLQAALTDIVAAGFKPHAYIADAGYPGHVVRELEDIADLAGADITIIGVGQFSSTNHAWNELLPQVSHDRILCLENDVIIQPGCLGHLFWNMATGPYSITVPTILEPDGSTPHFRPRAASIEHLSGHGIRVNLDRGRTGDAPDEHVREIQILERHGFLITRSAALSLGDWDELMYCRTDLDLSLLCDSASLRVAFVPQAQAQLAPEKLQIADVPFFDHRWDVHRVRRSHERLITKWQLTGYKRTYNHVFDNRKRLAELGF